MLYVAIERPYISMNVINRAISLLQCGMPQNDKMIKTYIFFNNLNIMINESLLKFKDNVKN